MDLTLPHMTPSVVSGGGTSQAHAHAAHVHTWARTPRTPRTSCTARCLPPQARYLPPQARCLPPQARYLPPQARQSFSTNMLPDWSDELDTVTSTLTKHPNPNPNPNSNPNPNPNPNQP